MSQEMEPIDRDTLLSILRTRLPQPFRENETGEGSIRWTAGDSGEVIVDLDDRELSVSGYVDRSAVLGRPSVAVERLGAVGWASAPSWTTQRILAELVAAAAILRQASFRPCLRCGRRFVPDEMQDLQTCRECAQHDVDVVF